MIRKIIITAISLSLAGVLTFFGVNWYVTGSTKDYVLTKEQAAGLGADCIVVLGAKVYTGGGLSPILEDRVLVGIDLYNSGAAPKILMSGDHGRGEYDEVSAMKDYALEKNVIKEDIFLDHAGFSTYDSMYRARDVFGAKKVVIVTQKFHINRAVYLARALGLEAYGVESDLRPYMGEKRNQQREMLARVKDFVYAIFKPEPKYLGDPIDLQSSGVVTHEED